MRVQILLADKGTRNPGQGTLNLLNVGWSQTPLRPAPPMVPGGLITGPHAVAIFFEIEHQYCNHPIELVLSLLTEDGPTVQLPGPAGPQEMRIRQMVTVMSPGGVPIGTPGNGNAIVEIFPGLPLRPGGYRWNVTLAGKEGEDWFAPFRVVPPPQGFPPVLEVPPSPAPTEES